LQLRGMFAEFGAVEDVLLREEGKSKKAVALVVMAEEQIAVRPTPPPPLHRTVSDTNS
jgi:hypothetical protein